MVRKKYVHLNQFNVSIFRYTLQVRSRLPYQYPKRYSKP